MNLSEKIVKHRKLNNWSQEDLAERLNVSRQSVSKWEVGSALPDANNILALSKLYNITTDYLLNDDYASDEDLPKVKENNWILRNNLTLIAIIAQASFLNAAAQPWVGEGVDSSLVLAFKCIPLLLASIWMSSNHRYERDKIQRAKNTKIEMIYCIIQAAIAVIGYINHWTLLTTVLVLTATYFYIFVVNPKYMNRKLVYKKK